jgi:hypothetical protein
MDLIVGEQLIGTLPSPAPRQPALLAAAGYSLRRRAAPQDEGMPEPAPPAAASPAPAGVPFPVAEVPASGGGARVLETATEAAGALGSGALADPACVVAGCPRPAMYGDPAVIWPKTHCSKCTRALGLFDYSSRRACQGCHSKQPSFGPLGSKQRTHCKTCVDTLGLDGYVNRAALTCEECLIKQPSYAKPGATKPTHCKACVDELELPFVTLSRRNTCEYCTERRPRYRRIGAVGGATACPPCLDARGLRSEYDNMKPKCVKCYTSDALWKEEGGSKNTHCGPCAKALNKRAPRKTKRYICTKTASKHERKRKRIACEDGVVDACWPKRWGEDGPFGGVQEMDGGVRGSHSQ